MKKYFTKYAFICLFIMISVLSGCEKSKTKEREPGSIKETVTLTPTGTSDVTLTPTGTSDVTFTPTSAMGDEQTKVPSITPTGIVNPTGYVTSGVSATPTITAIPVVSVTPAITVTPAVSAVPAITVTPDVSVTPGITATPAITDFPAVTSAPVITATPTISATPAATGTVIPTFPCDAWINCYYVSLRDINNVDNKVLRVYNGTKITLTGESENEFYFKCEYEGNRYLVCNKYITYKEMYEYDPDALTIVDGRAHKYSYSELTQDLKELSEKYPDIFSYYTAGKSSDNRNIYVCKVGNPNAEKVIFYTGTTHAREYCTTELLMMMTEYYLYNYNTGWYEDYTYKELFDEICVVMIPMLNPDGAEICINGPDAIRDAEIRKKVREMYKKEDAIFYEKYGYHYTTLYERWKANAVGIDLNRNYDYGWEETDDWYEPASSGYKGTEPFSAEEVKVQVKVLNELLSTKKVCFSVSYHATGETLSWDVGQTGEFRTECETAVKKLAYYTDYIENMNEMTYYAGKISLAGYTDWLNGCEIVPSVTIEILGSSVFLSCEVPDLSEAFIQNREVWAVLGSLYYEKEEN